MIRRLTSFFLVFLVAHLVAAQAPSGYYNNATGQKGRNLKTALHKIIKDHNAHSYDQLWNDFKKTDRRADGKVWDMYSNVTNYVFGGREQGANYKKEGDSYNREHSFPKSWFGGKVAPMNTDLFHLYPTDGYVNNRRSSFPFGETEGDYISANGWSKVGPSTVPGYSGTVFEPNDEYKGDFARTYFYMATRYEDKIAGWNSPMLGHDSYQAYAPWAIKMLLRWAKEDPVSEKEINRNNEVYKIQKNRNPFIDFPGLEQYVWGTKTNESFDPGNYNPDHGGGEVDPNPNPQPGDKKVEAPVFSLPSSTVLAGTTVTISCATKGASVYYTVNGGALQSNYASATLTINVTSEIEAYAMLGESKSEVVRASYQVETVPEDQGDVYEKAYSAADLVVGSKYLIVCEETNTALSGITGYNKNVRGAVEVVIEDRTITTEVSQEGKPYALTLSQDAQGYTFYDEASDKYLAVTEDKNILASIGSGAEQGAHWTIELSNGATNISNVAYSGRSIRYNSDSPRFSTYSNQQLPVALYKLKSNEVPDTENVAVPVFSVAAGEVRKGTPLNLTCATPGAMIYYRINEGKEQSHASPVQLTITEDVKIEAYAKLGDKQSDKVSVTYTVADAPVVGNGSFIKVTQQADLVPGSRYLIVCEDKYMAMGQPGGKYGKYRDAVNVDITAGVITTEVSSEGLPYAVTLGGDENGYTFYDAASQGYLALLSEKDNNLNTVEAPAEGGELWTIVFEEGNTAIRNMKFDMRTIRYNFSSPRFSTYKGGQGAVVLYKEYVDDTVEVPAPQFSVAEGEVTKGTRVSLSCAHADALIFYAVNGGDWLPYVAEEGIVVDEDMTVSAYAQVGERSSAVVKVSYTVADAPVVGDKVFVKIDQVSDLVAGASYLIVNEEYEAALSAPMGKEGDIRDVAYVTISANTIQSDLSKEGCPYALTLGGTAGAYTFYDAATGSYLAYTGKHNRLPSLATPTDDALWAVTITEGNAEIRSLKDRGFMIKYNNDQPRFVAYSETSQQLPVSLFMESSVTGIDYPITVNGGVDVYTLDGRKVREQVNKADAVKGLPRGLYIVGGVKLWVK